MKFRSARRPVSDEIDGHLQLNFRNIIDSHMKLRYEIYALTNLTNILPTPCGIRNHGVIVFNDTIDYKENA